MKYKVIMLDVDGTLVPYDYQALPTRGVIEAISKAKEKIHVCLVTGRSHGFAKNVLKALDLHSGYAVFNNGSQVMSLETEELIYDRPMDIKHARQIADLFCDEGIDFYLKQELQGLGYMKRFFKKEDPIETPYMFFTIEKYPEERIDRILKKLSSIPDITIHKGNHDDKQKFGLNIVHAEATKLHGVHTILKQYDLKSEEAIGMGDGYNDFPLLMACGLKVAMGNAVEDLKEIADVIAPTVEDDGVAYILEKYVLTSS